jgi:hypothetical protein
MKVTVEVDCTPEEARRFLGLPDVVPLQQAIMEKLQQRMQTAVDATTPDALLKACCRSLPIICSRRLPTCLVPSGDQSRAIWADIRRVPLCRTAATDKLVIFT